VDNNESIRDPKSMANIYLWDFCVFYRMEREKQREKERQSRQQQVSENNVKDKKELFGSPVKVISRL